MDSYLIFSVLSGVSTFSPQVLRELVALLMGKALP